MQSQSVMSKVPRWGALTFQEKVDNDMVLNRMKDIHAEPHKKDFIKINKKKSLEARMSPARTVGFT